MSPSSFNTLRHSLPSAGVQIDLGAFLVRVRSDLPGTLEHLRLLYPDFSITEEPFGHFDVTVAATSGVRRWIRPQANLIVDGRRPFLPLPATLAGPLLEWGTNWAITQGAHRHVAIHAAVVARGETAMILTAPSGAGKSTLCAALVFSGWRLFSDEFALVDPHEGTVWPSPRPISLKNASIGIVRTRYPNVVLTSERVDVEGATFVHARPPAESVHAIRQAAYPRLVILPKYSAGRPTTLERLSRAEALVHVCDQSFNYNFLGTAGYQCLATLVRQADCYRLEYSDLDDCLPRLADLAATR